METKRKNVVKMNFDTLKRFILIAKGAGEMTALDCDRREVNLILFGYIDAINDIFRLAGKHEIWECDDDIFDIYNDMLDELDY